jgi:hypothetical protein
MIRRLMKISPTIFPIAVLLAAASPAPADTITLKSGAKLEGRILEETATEVTVEYRESASIVDRKKIKRDDIASITKETPDMAAWAAIAASRPGANSLPAAQYESVLRPLTAFIAAYPQSAHVEEAKKSAAAWEEEKKRVDAGEVKINERWLSKEEAEKERYQINGVIALNHMRAQASGGDLIGALNSFAILEKNFGGSASMPDAVELAGRILPTLKATVERAYQNLKTEALGRQQAAPQSRAELEAAAKRDEDAGAASVVAAERAGQKWPPLNIRSSKSLAKIAEILGKETTRLAALPVAAMRQSITVAEGAKAALASGDLAGAEAALVGTKVWPANELAGRLTAELTAAKKAAADAAKITPAAATPAPVAAPVAAPKPGAPKAAPAAAAAPSGAAPVEVKPFYLTPIGVASMVGVVALVVIGLRIFYAMRARREDED